MPRPLTLACAALALMAACGTPDIRVPVPDSAPDLRVSSRYASVEVVEVQLPTYAADEKIFVQQEDGSLLPLGPLWADDPARAMTLQLARDLGRITGAQVAPEPWPFRDFAQARVDVRLSDMRAEAGGDFLLAGQYFVAPDEGGRGRSGQFAIRVPMAQPATAASIAAARAQAVTQLAGQIAQTGL